MEDLGWGEGKREHAEGHFTHFPIMSELGKHEDSTFRQRKREVSVQSQVKN